MTIQKFRNETLLDLAAANGGRLIAYPNDGFGPEGGRIVFDNGYSVSVAYGHGNYCDRGMTTAETAVVDERAPGQPFVRLPGDHDDVQGWQTWDDVATLVAVVAGLTR